MPPALIALFAAAFAIGTAEFVIAGILPAVSADLQISIPTAGLLVSIYALGVAVGGPVLATFTGRYPKKLLLLIYVAIFTVGHVFCALAPNYGFLLGSRVAVALIHGAYFGTAMVAAIGVVPESRRGFAVALILAGLTVANIVGVPLGTAVGTAFGWRATFWGITILGVLAFLAIFFVVPADKKRDVQQGSLAAEARALLRQPVVTSMAIIIWQTIGQFALFTYISPLLTGISGVPEGWVPWLLLSFGLGSTVGVLVGGRLTDWKLMPSLIGILTVQLVSYALMVVFVTNGVMMAILVLVWGATSFAFGAPIQTRIFNSTLDAPTLAANLIPSAFNVAIALGAWIGGSLINGGFSYAVLPWVGVISAAFAISTSVLASRLDRRPARAAA